MLYLRDKTDGGFFKKQTNIWLTLRKHPPPPSLWPANQSSKDQKPVEYEWQNIEGTGVNPLYRDFFMYTNTETLTMGGRYRAENMSRGCCTLAKACLHHVQPSKILWRKPMPGAGQLSVYWDYNAVSGTASVSCLNSFLPLWNLLSEVQNGWDEKKQGWRRTSNCRQGSCGINLACCVPFNYHVSTWNPYFLLAETGMINHSFFLFSSNGVLECPDLGL